IVNCESRITWRHGVEPVVIIAIDWYGLRSIPGGNPVEWRLIRDLCDRADIADVIARLFARSKVLGHSSLLHAQSFFATINIEGGETGHGNIRVVGLHRQKRIGSCVMHVDDGTEMELSTLVGVGDTLTNGYASVTPIIIGKTVERKWLPGPRSCYG